MSLRPEDSSRRSRSKSPGRARERSRSRSRSHSHVRDGAGAGQHYSAVEYHPMGTPQYESRQPPVHPVYPT